MFATSFYLLTLHPEPEYLPDILSRDGIVELLATACLAELQNTVCPLSYKPTDDDLWILQLGKKGMTEEDALEEFDVSAAPYTSRLENIFGRGRACILLKAVFSRVVLTNDKGEHLDGWNDLFIPMLAWLIAALQGYSRQAFAKKHRDDKDEGEEYDSSGENEPEAADDKWTEDDRKFQTLFNRQIEWTSCRWNELQEAVKRLANESVQPDLLEWDMPYFTVAEKPGPSWQSGMAICLSALHYRS